MPDEIVLKFTVKDDGTPVIERVNKKIRETGDSTKVLAPGIENARKKMMDFTSANAGLIAVLAGTAVAIKKVYDVAKQGADIEFTKIKFDRLAKSVGTTSDVLLGRMKVATQGTLSDMEAMAAATDLLSLGLAKNADEAVRLATVQSGLAMDTNQLVLALSNQTTMRFDQLGLSVDGFDEKVKKLEATGMSANDAFKEAFLQQAEEQLKRVGSAADTTAGDFKKLEAEFKNFTDAAKVGTSKAVVPFVQQLNKNIEESGFALGVLRFGFDDVIKAIMGTDDEQKDLNNTITETGEVASNTVGSVEELAVSEEVLKEATSRLSKEFEGLLSSMFTIQDGMDDYEEKTADIAKREQELREEKGRLALEMANVNNNQEKYLSLVKESIGIDEELKSLDEEKTKAAESLADASKQRIYDLTQQRLAADGLIDSGEFEYLQDLAVQQGLVSRAAANLAIEESKKADAFVQSYQSTNPLMKDQLAIMQQMQAMSGTVVQFSVNYTSNMPNTNPFGSKGAPKYAPVNQYTTPLYSGTTKTRDSGGPGVAGEPYAIGNIREVYVPKESGTFIPLGKARGESIGNTYNIVINNPKKETSEASLSNVLRRISYTGAAA